MQKFYMKNHSCYQENLNKNEMISLSYDINDHVYSKSKFCFIS